MDEDLVDRFVGEYISIIMLMSLVDRIVEMVLMVDLYLRNMSLKNCKEYLFNVRDNFFLSRCGYFFFLYKVRWKLKYLKYIVLIVDILYGIVFKFKLVDN